MQKLRIKIEINEHIIEGIGKIDNDVIILKTKEELIKYDTKKTIIYKKNKDLIITLDFLNNKVFYELPNESKKFSNNLVIFSLTNNHKQVIINYQIEQAEFLLKINYETI